MKNLMNLTLPLSKCFGPGEPGWLARDVPVNTEFDFAAGRSSGPAGTFVRSPATGQWARAH